MAYTCDGVDQRMTATADIADVYPSTVALWFRCADNTVDNGYVMSLNDQTGTSVRIGMSPDSSSLFFFDARGATGYEFMTIGYLSNTWHSAIYTLTSTTSRAGYLDGTMASSTDDTGAIDTIVETSLGVNWNGGAYQSYYLGDMANVGIWNVVLTASERLALDQGVSPRLIRPNALVFHRSLVRPLNHPFIGSTLSNPNSATVSEHPRLITMVSGFNSSIVSSLSISVVDAVTVAEAIGAGVGTIVAAVADAVAVGDSVIVSVGSGNDSATMLISGTQDDINATLATLLYTSDSGYTGADSLLVVSTNLTSNVDTDTVAITVVAAPAAADFDIETLAEAPPHRRHFAQIKKETP